MRIHTGLIVGVLLLCSTQTLAGTKVKMNIVPSPADCFLGPNACLNVPLSCSVDNSECALGTMSNKSKLLLKGDLSIKVKIKGVTDGSGALMTTGPAETAVDDLVLKLAFSTCPVDTGSPPLCDDPTNVYLKVVLTNGAAQLQLPLAPVLALPAGSPVNFLGASLWAAPGLGNCLGDNSTIDITARINDGTCEFSGIVRGVGGITTE